MSIRLFKLVILTILFSLNIRADVNDGWRTFISGNQSDDTRCIVFDNNGDIVIAGNTRSSDFPTTPGAFQTQNKGNRDIFVMKFDNQGGLLWSTLIGSPNQDNVFQIGIDSKNNIWIGGESFGYGFPVLNAFQENYAGGTADAVLIKFSENGELLYSTYYGGSGYEVIGDLVIDENDNIWTTGRTHSSNFPVTPDAIQLGKKGTYDAFLLGFNNEGERTISTFWGGNDSEFAEGIALDPDGNIAISGYTYSDDYPVTPNCYQDKYNGNFDAFIVKFARYGKPEWSTYFGGNSFDYGSNLASDSEGNFIISGYTSSSDLPTDHNSFQQEIGGGCDAMIVKFSPGGELLWTTYYGGSGNEGYNEHIINDAGGGVYTNSNGDILVVGRFTTSMNNFISNDSFQNSINGESDTYILLFDKNGGLKWSTYLGGIDTEAGLGACFDPFSNIYAVGYTESPDFPVTENAYQSGYKGNGDGFIVNFLTESECDPTYFDFPATHSSSDFQYSGEGKARPKDSINNNEYFRLTESLEFQAGASWYRKQVPVRKGFTTDFSFRFTEGINGLFIDGSLPGADGIAFVIQNTSENILGQSGGGIGYAGIPNSFAVEIDTYNNNLKIDSIFDENGNHLSVQCNGLKKNIPCHQSDAMLGITNNIPIIRTDGTIYYVKIDYNVEPGVMTIYMDTTGLFETVVLEISSLELDKLLDLNGGTLAWVGITSATGHAREVHDILSWYMCPFHDDPGVNVEDDLMTEEAGLSLYPNPSSGIVSIDFVGDGIDKVVIAVYNSYGEQVSELYNGIATRGRHSLHWDTEGLPQGLYYCRITRNNEEQVKGISIIR